MIRIFYCIKNISLYINAVEVLYTQQTHNNIDVIIQIKIWASPRKINERSIYGSSCPQSKFWRKQKCSQIIPKK